MIEMPASLVGVNTSVPNRLVFESVKQGLVKELTGYEKIQKETKVGNNSRIDLLLSSRSGQRCFVEIKNCTLVTDDHIAFFPDAVTTRGRKHLTELERLAEKGDRCVMFYLVQRMDAARFEPADHIDPAYGKALREASLGGVEIVVYDVIIDLEKIVLGKKIPYRL